MYKQTVDRNVSSEIPWEILTVAENQSAIMVMQAECIDSLQCIHILSRVNMDQLLLTLINRMRHKIHYVQFSKRL